MGFIYITSFGNIESRLLLATARNIKEIFGFDVRLSSVPFPPRLGYNPARDQYHAGTILSYLSSVSFPHLIKLVVLVSFDLYEENMNFVFGEAQLGGRNAVVSIYRLRDKREKLFFERTFKEVNHELGHTFGLAHCDDPLCVMNFSNSLTDVDVKQRHFCERCRAKLESAFDLYR